MAAFAVLTVALTYPLSIEPATRVLPLSADTRLFLWTLSWDVHALTHRPWRLFDANIFYPEPRTLAYSEHLVGSAALGTPFLFASGNPVLALNAIVLMSCVLSGAGAFFLARRVGVGTVGALAAGVIFAFAPPRFARLAQVHLATVQWIPFCLGFLHAYLQEGRRRQLLAAIACFTLQATTSGHGGLFLLLAIATLALCLLAHRRGLPLRKTARDVGFAGIALLAVNLLFLVPYVRVQQEAGLHRTIGAVSDWSPDAASFIAAPTHAQQALISLIPSLARRATQAKAYLFPGWIALALAALALLRRRQLGESPMCSTGHYALLAGLSLWASLGPGFGLYRFLYHVVPGFDLIRVPSRLTILTLLSLAVLAGTGLDRWLERVRPAVRPALSAAVIALLVIEFAAFPLKAPPYPIEIPAVDRWLAEQPRPFALAELPVPDPADAVLSARLHSHYMLHSMSHWQPMVNGYSGLTPPRHQELFRLLGSFPDEPSLRALEAIGVNFVVLHRGFYGDTYAAVVARADGYAPRLRLEHEADDGRVYSLTFSRARR